MGKKKAGKKNAKSPSVKPILTIATCVPIDVEVQVEPPDPDYLAGFQARYHVSGIPEESPVPLVDGKVRLHRMETTVRSDVAVFRDDFRTSASFVLDGPKHLVFKLCRCPEERPAE